MTDSLSMMNTLARETEQRLASQERDLAMLKGGKMRVYADEGGGERDISSNWIARLEEWILADKATLARFGNRA